MSENSYSKYIVINQNVESVFNAVTSQIDAWWTVNSNSVHQIGDLLTVEFENNTSWIMEVVEFNNPFKTKWKVINAVHNLKGLSKKDEWNGTIIEWNLCRAESGTKVEIRHNGLIPSLECYNICSDGWDYFLLSLKKLLELGKGTPYKV